MQSHPVDHPVFGDKSPSLLSDTIARDINAHLSPIQSILLWLIFFFFARQAIYHLIHIFTHTHLMGRGVSSSRLLT
jgi:hypothetical protein